MRRSRGVLRYRGHGPRNDCLRTITVLSVVPQPSGERWRPENLLPIPLFDVGRLTPKQSTENAQAVAGIARGGLAGLAVKP